MRKAPLTASVLILLVIGAAVAHDLYFNIPFGPFACENAQGHSTLPACN